VANVLGTFQQEARILAEKKTIVARGRFEALWRRQKDGTWLLARMSTAAPPPGQTP
jgi:ketosteroid isomerase-like protein